MRSPIQILIEHLELLQDKSGESVEDIEAALDGATTLQRMTNSLLDVSRLEAGRMPLQRSLTDLSVLAHSVVTRIRILQPTRDITVETSGDSACDCDPELTRRPYSAEGLRSATGDQSSGLGLAFCTLAVEAQGGAIRIEDGTPHGNVFVVELPRREQQSKSGA